MKGEWQTPFLRLRVNALSGEQRLHRPPSARGCYWELRRLGPVSPAYRVPPSALRCQHSNPGLGVTGPPGVPCTPWCCAHRNRWFQGHSLLSTLKYEHLLCSLVPLVWDLTVLYLPISMPKYPKVNQPARLFPFLLIGTWKLQIWKGQPPAYICFFTFPLGRHLEIPHIHTSGITSELKPLSNSPLVKPLTRTLPSLVI